MGKTDQGVVTLWLAKHYWKRKLKYIGYGGLGKQVRDILHINDLMNLIDIQIHQPEKFTNKVFNAGGGIKNSASLAEMTVICEKITGNRIEIESETNSRPADLRCFITDYTRIESEIGWVPEHGLESIFSDIFCWIKENENKLKPILS
jgi:CDP-paratose 2-epimerase